MRTVTLGRTNIVTTSAGLGCGGFSKIGLEKYGEAHAAGIVRHAYDLGVRFFDTATSYGTETAVGKGLEGCPRDSYVISTKFPIWDEWRPDYVTLFRKTLDESLRALKTDYIDIYNIHAVYPPDYNDVREMLVPEMLTAQKIGKIRFPGITEGFIKDTGHEMLKSAMDDDIFDVIMTGYNMMNPSAAKTVFPRAIKQNTGVLCMFAVRHAMSNIEQMIKDIEKILENNQGGADLKADAHALDFLMPAAKSIMDAAYRFCAHTEGIHVTLTGTSSKAHLEDNLRSLEAGPLPQDILDKLEQLFGLSDCVSGQ